MKASEVERAMLRRYGCEYPHRFWFATPAGLVEPDEIPERCGLYEVGSNGTAIRVQAPLRKAVEDLPREAFVEAARRESKLREQHRAAERDGGLEAIPGLKADLNRALRAKVVAGDQKRAAVERSKELIRLVATTVDPVLCQCGGIIRPTARVAKGGHIAYVHVGETPLVPRQRYIDGQYREVEEPCSYAHPDFDAMIAVRYPDLMPEAPDGP